MSASQAKARELYKQAQAIYNQDNGQEILRLLDEAIQLGLEEPRAYFMRGTANFALARYKQAEADYKAALALHPDFLDAVIALANILAHQDKYQESLIYYERADQLSPGNALIVFNVGNIHFQLKHYNEAIQAYSRYIGYDPTDAWAYFCRGCAFSLLGQHGKGLEDLQKASEVAKVDTLPQTSEEIVPGAMLIALVWLWAELPEAVPQGERAEELIHQIEAIEEVGSGEALSLRILCYGLTALLKAIQAAPQIDSSQLATASSFFLQAERFHLSWEAIFWQGFIAAICNDKDTALQSIDKALEEGLPPLLLKPLSWLSDAEYKAVLQRYGLMNAGQ